MSPLRVGIIGLGVGEQHLKTYLKQPLCRVTQICDIDRSKLKSLHSRYPDIPQTTHENDILKSPYMDVVSIASFDHMHARQVITALNHNKHVFVEKPLCQTPAQL